jgi:hypothetical protein
VVVPLFHGIVKGVAAAVAVLAGFALMLGIARELGSQTAGPPDSWAATKLGRHNALRGTNTAERDERIGDDQGNLCRPA